MVDVDGYGPVRAYQEKGPAGATPPTSSCSCRLEVRFRCDSRSRARVKLRNPESMHSDILDRFDV